MDKTKFIETVEKTGWSVQDQKDYISEILTPIVKRTAKKRFRLMIIILLIGLFLGEVIFSYNPHSYASLNQIPTYDIADWLDLPPARTP